MHRPLLIWRNRANLVVSVLLLGACTREQSLTDTNPVDSGMSAAIASDPAPTPAGPSLDDLFLQVSRDVPGFGGIFVDEDGALVIQLVDSAQGDAARSAVERTFGAEPAVRDRATRLNAARFSFSQLNSWRGTIDEKGPPAEVRLIDIDERANVIRIGTVDQASAGGVAQWIEAIGIPRSAVVTEPVPAMSQLTDYLSSRVRPVLGGLVVATTAGGCSLGFKAKKTGATRYVATNAHCTSTFGSVDGTQLGQPLLQSNYFIGTESDDPAFVSGGGCATGYSCRWSDATLVQCDTIAACSGYTIARTTSQYTGSDWSQSGSSTLTTEPWYVVGEASSGSLIMGASLSKVGSTSGWTGGTIVSTCGDWQVATGKKLRCQYEFSGVARGGDSGSPVFQFEDATGKAWLAGMMWGSNGSSATVFSPLAGIKTDLGSLTVSSPVF